jgi:hypothetical protein
MHRQARLSSSSSKSSNCQRNLLRLLVGRQLFLCHLGRQQQQQRDGRRGLLLNMSLNSLRQVRLQQQR